MQNLFMHDNGIFIFYSKLINNLLIIVYALFNKFGVKCSLILAIKKFQNFHFFELKEEENI